MYQIANETELNREALFINTSQIKNMNPCPHQKYNLLYSIIFFLAPNNK